VRIAIAGWVFLRGNSADHLRYLSPTPGGLTPYIESITGKEGDVCPKNRSPAESSMFAPVRGRRETKENEAQEDSKVQEDVRAPEVREGSEASQDLRGQEGRAAFRDRPDHPLGYPAG
jgi:hypothetical protein